MAKQDFYTSLVLILLGVTVVVESLRMPRLENLGVNPYTVPGIVPGILGGIISLLGLVMLVRSSRAETQVAEVKGPSEEGLKSESTRRLGLTLLLTLGYAVFLVGTLPFWLATLVFVFLFISIFEWQTEATSSQKLRSLGIALLQAVLVAAAVTFVFERIFLVRLP